MPAFTVQQLIDRAAAIADMHDNFVTPAQWCRWYDIEARALELFIARSGWVQDLAATSDAVSGTITLTGVPLAVLGVYEVRDGRYRALKFQNQVDFTRQSYSSPADTGDAHYYTVLTSNSSDDVTIQFYPKPASGTYRALYLAGRTDSPVTEASSVRWPLGWEERIVLGMAEKALTKEESDTRPIEKLIAREEQTIEEFCWSRQMANSAHVRNIDRTERGWSDDMTFGPYESWYWL